MSLSWILPTCKQPGRNLPLVVQLPNRWDCELLTKMEVLPAKSMKYVNLLKSVVFDLGIYLTSLSLRALFLRRFLYVTCVISRTEQKRSRKIVPVSYRFCGEKNQSSEISVRICLPTKLQSLLFECWNVPLQAEQTRRQGAAHQPAILRSVAGSQSSTSFFSDGRSFLHDKTNFPKVKQHFTVVTGNHAYTGFPLCKSRSHQQGEK